MTVLSINKYFWRKGGSETVFFSEKALLEEHGHQVIPFCMSSDNNEHSDYKQFFIDEVDYSNHGIISKLVNGSKIIYNFDAKKKMKQLLGVTRPELAHFHIFQHQISPSVFSPLRELNIPIVLSLHDLKPLCPNYKMFVNGSVCEKCKGGKFYHCTLNRCTKGSLMGSVTNSMEMYFHKLMGYYNNVDHFIALSQFYRKKMIEFGFPQEKITYLPNHIDVSDYKTPQDEGQYILYFGRLSEEKGILTLLDAARKNPQIPLRIAGSGPLEDMLKKEVLQSRLHQITFLGHLSGDELKAAISGARSVVVPSEWYENCPMSVLESYAAGRPVIGADIGGISELIDHEYDGLLFTSGDAVDLSQKILCLYENPGLARSYGAAGREKIEKRFNKATHYKNLVNIYNAVLSDN